MGPIRAGLTVTFLAWAVASCGSDEEAASGGDGSDSGSSSSGGETGNPNPTAPNPTAGSTGGGPGGTGDSTGADSTSGPPGTTTGPVATTTATDSSTSSTGAPPPECMIDDDCGDGQSCVDGMCVEQCGGMWGAGDWAGCMTDLGGQDPDGLCGAPGQAICATFAWPIEGSACSVQSCTSECDCPAPPATGDAVVTCGALPGTDMEADCYLSCENGETCPDGMVCFDGTACMAEVVAEVPMYGNCGNLVTDCAPGLECVTENGVTGCVSLCPGGVGDCDPAPVGANPEECNGVIFPPNGADCHLPCIADGDCPDGMVCYDDPSVFGGDSLCMWPYNPPPIPGGNCCGPMPMGMAGCEVPAIESCTCALDGFCCSTEWDMICVDIALMSCNMVCI